MEYIAQICTGGWTRQNYTAEEIIARLEKITEMIQKEKIEGVLIAGDIYDKSIPSTDAINLLDNILNKLIKELKIKVYIIAGNHDSKERLGFGNKIFENYFVIIFSGVKGRNQHTLDFFS